MMEECGDVKMLCVRVSECVQCGSYETKYARRRKKRLTFNLVPVLVVNFFDFSIPKCELSHPIDATSHRRWNCK